MCSAWCLSFCIHSTYSGKLDTFDQEVYWANIVARLLAPAVLLHFALVFPGRSETTLRSSSKALTVYLPPLALLLVHISTARNALGFVPWLGSRILLDKIELTFLGACFLAAGSGILQEFSRGAIRCFAAAIQMADRRNAGRAPCRSRCCTSCHSLWIWGPAGGCNSRP